MASRDPGAPYYTGLHYCVRAYQSGFIYSLLWEEGSDKDSGVFDKILGTFRFLDTVVPSSVPNVKNIKVLNPSNIKELDATIKEFLAKMQHR